MGIPKALPKIRPFEALKIARWIRVLVEPNVPSCGTLGEEQDIGLNAGVRVEHAVGQPDDRVQVALFEQMLLEASLDAFAE